MQEGDTTHHLLDIVTDKFVFAISKFLTKTSCVLAVVVDIVADIVVLRSIFGKELIRECFNRESFLQIDSIEILTL